LCTCVEWDGGKKRSGIEGWIEKRDVTSCRVYNVTINVYILGPAEGFLGWSGEVFGRQSARHKILVYS
jgi:hypothetical protein